MLYIDIDGQLYGVDNGEIVSGPFKTLAKVIDYTELSIL